MATTTKVTHTTRPAANNRPTTLDHLLSQKKPVEKHVYIPFDGDVTDALEDARQAFGLAQMMGQDADEKRIALTAAEDAVREASAHFLFRGIGRKAYQKLLESCPATEAQLKKNAQMPYDVDSLRPKVIAASLVTPILSEADVRRLIEDDNWNDAEIQVLFDSAVAVNTNVRAANLGN